MTENTAEVNHNPSPAANKAAAERYVELLAGSAVAKVHWHVFPDQVDVFAQKRVRPRRMVVSERHLSPRRHLVVAMTAVGCAPPGT